MKQKKKEPVGVIILILDYLLIFLSLGLFWIVKYMFRVFKRVYIFHLAKFKKDKLLKSSLKKIDRMDGVSFEVYLCALFEELGYRVERTKASNDYGADLILKKNFRKIIVQAKCYKRNVSISAVQQAHTAIKHYRASEAWVVTNSGFTVQAKCLAAENGVVLIDRSSLIQLMDRVKEKRNLGD